MELGLKDHLWYGFLGLIPQWYYIRTLCVVESFKHVADNLCCGIVFTMAGKAGQAKGNHYGTMVQLRSGGHSEWSRKKDDSSKKHS